MSDATRGSLEERVTSLEAQLCKAQERIASFEASRQRSIRGWLAGMASVFGLAFVVAQAVTANGLTNPQSLTVEAPFVVVDSLGHRIFVIKNNNGEGGVAQALTTSGKNVAALGVTKQGGGAVGVYDPGDKYAAEMFGQSSGAFLDIKKDGNFAALFGLGVLTGNDNAASLALTTATGSPLAILQIEKGNGNLQLMDSKENIRVEAGTDEAGDGEVHVSGPEGKCYPGIAGVPCILLGH